MREREGVLVREREGVLVRDVLDNTLPTHKKKHKQKKKIQPKVVCGTRHVILGDK